MVAAVFYLVARLSFSMKFAYINAALWIPIGLAQAAVLVWGRRMAIGVFLGAFLVRLWMFDLQIELPYALLNIDISHTGQVFLLAGMSAFGIAMQTWVLAWAIKAAVKKLPPETVVETVKTICIIALANSIVPLLFVSGLAAAGQLPSFRQYAAVFLDLWFALFIGLTLITPVATIFGLKLRAVEKIQQPILWPLASMIIGLSFFTFFLIESGNRQKAITMLRDDTKEIAHVLDDAMVFHEMQSVTAMEGFFSNSSEVLREEFELFASAFLDNYSSGTAFLWLPRVDADNHSDMEQFVCSGMAADCFIHEYDASGKRVTPPVRNEYFPVAYIAPHAVNKDLVGFDNASRPERLEALERARDSGEFAVTAPLLFQQDSDDLTILVIMPLYERGLTPGTVQARRNELSGYVLGAFNIDSVIDTAMIGPQMNNIEWYLYDVTDPSAPQYLAYYSSDDPKLGLESIPSLESIKTGLFDSEEVFVGGRTWQVVVRTTASYLDAGEWWHSWAGLLAGLTLAFAFLIYVYSTQSAKDALIRSEKNSVPFPKILS